MNWMSFLLVVSFTLLQAKGRPVIKLSPADQNKLRNVKFTASSQSDFQRYIREKNPSYNKEPFRITMMCKLNRTKQYDCQPSEFNVMDPVTAKDVKRQNKKSE